MPVTENLRDRVDALERITKLFRAERIVYLVICTLAILMLLTSAGVLIVKHQASIEVLVPLFGSSGLIAFSLARVLRMWDKAIEFLASEHRQEGNE